MSFRNRFTKPKKSPCQIETRQGNLLEDLPGTSHKFIDLNHPLVILGDRIDWSEFEAYWESCFANSKSGRYSSSARMVGGLLMIKHMDDLSDAQLILGNISSLA